MRKYLETLIQTLVLAMFTFFMNFALSNYTSDKGGIYTDILNISNKKYLYVMIENYSNDIINNLLLDISRNVKISDITSSAAIVISNVKDVLPSSPSKLVEISNIPPNTSTKFYIPINDDFSMRFINNKSLHLSNMNSHKPNIFYESLIFALTSSFFYFLFFYFINAHRFALVERFDRESSALRTDIDKLQHEHNTLVDKLKKHHIILLSRLSEYSKELSFWRDTIRKIMYKTKDQKNDAELIINTVTENLKTYSIREKKETDFDSLLVLNNILKVEENK